MDFEPALIQTCVLDDTVALRGFIDEHDRQFLATIDMIRDFEANLGRQAICAASGTRKRSRKLLASEDLDCFIRSNAHFDDFSNANALHPIPRRLGLPQPKHRGYDHGEMPRRIADRSKAKSDRTRFKPLPSITQA